MSLKSARYLVLKFLPRHLKTSSELVNALKVQSSGKQALILSGNLAVLFPVRRGETDGRSGLASN